MKKKMLDNPGSVRALMRCLFHTLFRINILSISKYLLVTIMNFVFSFDTTTYVTI